MATTTEKKKAAPRATTTTRVKKVKAATTEEAKAAPMELSKGEFVSAIGRRKTAIARVRVLKNGSGLVRVNNKPLNVYFPTAELQDVVNGPLKSVSLDKTLDVSIIASGGGVHSQAEAVRLGISRALLKIDAEFRKSLRKLGFLTRDPRAKERKKPGLRRARRAPQWSKR